MIAAVLFVFASAISFSSCKSCNKPGTDSTTKTDSTATPAVQAPLNNINLPHADSSLAPVLAKVLDDIFDASKKKDYAKLGSLLVYRGTDMKRFGYDVFNTKNAYERGVVKVTADVFNKWNNNCENREYARIFSLPQQDGREMVVAEVMFISSRGVSREFFGFLPLKEKDYKLIDVTSNLSVQ